MTTAPPPLEVVYAADQRDAERLAAEPVTSVGIVVFEDEVEDRPQLAEGIPDPVVIGAVTVPVTLDPVLCRQRGFKAKAGSTMVALGTAGAPAVVYIGGGDAATFDLEGLRRAAAAFTRAAGRSGTAVLVVPHHWRERPGPTATGGPPRRRPKGRSSPATGSWATRARTRGAGSTGCSCSGSCWTPPRAAGGWSAGPGSAGPSGWLATW